MRTNIFPPALLLAFASIVLAAPIDVPRVVLVPENTGTVTARGHDVVAKDVVADYLAYIPTGGVDILAKEEKAALGVGRK
ncbi:hypothetical protein B0H16DRAFT_1530661 [Mycena metata]|uniref:Uncharacterized protein n=1 Tax=Mycena metata TaxID=1033252 RepID=A0AAD7NI76_9AGAR|nr:hypothetical protein B0H16DRAFT_1530661 [Mycena metata]